MTSPAEEGREGSSKSHFSRYKRQGMCPLALQKEGHLLKQQTWDFQEDLGWRSGRGMGLKEAVVGIGCCNLTFIISKLILVFFAFGKKSQHHDGTFAPGWQAELYRSCLPEDWPDSFRDSLSSQLLLPLSVCMTFDHEACGKRVTSLWFSSSFP